MHDHPMRELVETYLERMNAALRAVSAEDLDRLVERLATLFRLERTLYLLGNGGSAATASHMVCDLQRVGRGEQRLRAFSLADNTPFATATANDLGYEHLFAEALRGLLVAGDLVLALSTSGRSPNLLRALELAPSRGAGTAALLGGDGGPARLLAETSVIVPDTDPKLVENIHGALAHLMSMQLQVRLGSRSPS